MRRPDVQDARRHRRIEAVGLVDEELKRQERGTYRPGLPPPLICRSPSELAAYQQKAFRVDDHIGVVISGLTADARSLLKHMRGECLSHRFVYGSSLQAERLVLDVADKHQRATQSYVRRPYGVGLLVAAFDRTGPHLFQARGGPGCCARTILLS